MRTFTFIMNDIDSEKYEGSTNKSVTYSIEADDATVDNMLYHFKVFLSGCDYFFGVDDTFELVRDE
jgi:hypothetical protein